MFKRILFGVSLTTTPVFAEPILSVTSTNFIATCYHLDIGDTWQTPKITWILAPLHEAEDGTRVDDSTDLCVPTYTPTDSKLVVEVYDGMGTKFSNVVNIKPYNRVTDD